MNQHCVLYAILHRSTYRLIEHRTQYNDERDISFQSLVHTIVDIDTADSAAHVAK